MTAHRHTGALPCHAPLERGIHSRPAAAMKRWVSALLLMLGGLGAEALRPGPCPLIVDNGMPQLRDRRERRDDKDRLDGPERRRRGF